jgi:flagellar biosynthesis protein FlhG
MENNQNGRENMAESFRTRDAGPQVWAVGGGKGGVGKSVITANLAIALAGKGKRCVMVDADLGGANLHTMIGIPHPQVSLTDFFRREASSLKEILVPTAVPNLQLISGAKALLDMANPHHAQKEKVIRHLLALDVDYILLDLGAGSSFNMLDFFLAAHHQILVVTPTPTSIENAYHFLKAVFYRKLKKAVHRVGAARIVVKAMEEKMVRGIRSPRDLIADLERTAPEAGQAVIREMGAFAPGLILNQTRREEETAIGRQIAAACRDFFGMEINFLGVIGNDDRVYYAVQKRRPVLMALPKSPFALSMERLAAHVLSSAAGSPGPKLYSPAHQPMEEERV